jgi:antitoxin component YwqK of YwqJK toxin-antitoxin module
MKCIPLAFFLLACTQTLHSQYYYNDIIAAVQSEKQYQVLKEAHVKEVNATSIEADGKAAEGFMLKQQLTADYRKMVTNVSNPATGTSITTHYYTNNRLASTADSSDKVMTITTYTYLPDTKVAVITSVTNDAARSYRSEEIHFWQYRADGQPLQMLKIKDKKDTTVVAFILDEQGNVAEERWSRKGRRTETYYYYYNAQQQLTDIVRYNIKAKRLLPDYLFEYDATGRVSQMTQVPAGTSNYMVWKYVFTAQGLKQRELCYNKQQQLVGRIEYTYSL